jgi:outer membrane immunogenic protein
MRLRTVVVVASSIIASSSAFAADLPPGPPVAQAPAVYVPTVAPVYNWGGIYVGGNVGWGWTNVDLTDVGPDFPGLPPFPPGNQVFPLGTTSSLKQNGFLGGAQLGFNYQVNQFVVGLEGDFDATAIKNNQNTPGSSGNPYTDPWMGTIAARFGWAADRALFYGKAGGAWIQEKYDLAVPNGSAATGTFNRWGWTIGGGIEYAIWDNVTAKVEYDFMDFGSQNQALTANAADLVTGNVTGDTNKSQLTASVVKVGVNYLFH